MANVTGESEKQVSSYMTAVWNNFEDGSHTVEYYADVMTKLGAATASSTEEIATGLEKFASVGKTVGLSYEYATSALATVVDQTRQSPEIVGTAFKTLFARIQDLELGNALDDGTTLGTYSQALEKIGVHIQDAKGEVRDMDDILDDMGEKWKTIDKSTQIAVAQAVAGTRQYTQLIALMDNWDKFQTNVGYANTSEGELQAQADIYAESWKAAKKNVQADLESIYSTLLNDDFFIDLIHSFDTVIKSADSFVQTIGGIPGMISTISAMLLPILNKKIPDAFSNILQNLKITFGVAQKEIKETQDTTILNLKNAQESKRYSDSEKMSFKAQEVELTMKQKLQDAESRMTEEQQKKYLQMIKTTKATLDQAAAYQRLSENIGETIEVDKREMSRSLRGSYREIYSYNEEAARQGRNLRGRNIPLRTPEQTEALRVEEEKRNRLQEINHAYTSLTGAALPDNFTTSIKNILERTEKNLPQIDANHPYNVDFDELFSLDENAQGSILRPVLDSIKKRVKEASYTHEVGSNMEDGFNLFENNGQLKGGDTRSNRENAFNAYQSLFNQINSSLLKGDLSTDFDLNDSLKNLKDFVQQLNSEMQEDGSNIEDINRRFSEYFKQNDISSIFEKYEATIFDEYSDLQSFLSETLGIDRNAVREYIQRLQEQVDNENRGEDLSTLGNRLSEEDPKKMGKGAQIFDATSQSLTTVASTLNATSAAADGLVTVFDDTASVTEKVGSVIGGLTTSLFALKAIVDLNKTAILEEINSRLMSKMGNLGTAMGGNAFLKTLGPIGIAAIVATVAGIAYKTYREYQSKNYKEQTEQLGRAGSVQTENTSNLKEESDQVKELSSSYDALIEQYEKGTLSSDDLRLKAQQLCEQYGDTDLAVKSLTLSYKELQKAIHETEQNAAKATAESARTEQSIYKQQMSAALRSAAYDDNKYRNGNIKLKSTLSADTATTLSNLGVQIIGKEISISSLTDALAKDSAAVIKALNIDSSKGAIQLQKYIEQNVQSAIDSYNDATDTFTSAIEQSISTQYSSISIKSAKEFTKYAKEMANQIQEEGIFDTEEEAEQWAVKALKTSNSSDNISKYAQSALISLDSYEKIFSNALERQQKEADQKTYLKNLQGSTLDKYNALVDYFGGEENLPKMIREVVENSLKDLRLSGADVGDSYAEWANRNGGIYDFKVRDSINAYLSSVNTEEDQNQQMLSKAEKFKDQYEELLSDKTLTEQSYLADVPFLIYQSWLKNGENIQKAVEDIFSGNQEAIQYQGERAASTYLLGIAEGIAKNKNQITAKTIQEGLDNYNIGDLLGADSKTIANMSATSQGTLYMTSYLENLRKLQASPEAKQEWLNVQKQNKEAYEKLNQQYLDKFDNDSYKQFKDIAQEIGENGQLKYGVTQKQLETLATQYSSQGDNAFKDSDVYNKLLSGGKSESEIKALLNSYNEAKKVKDGYDKLKTSIVDVTNNTYDYKKVSEELTTQQKNVQSSLDNIQSSYNTLKSAIKSYNTYGIITLDNLQSLIQMSPEYLQCLVEENGQLKLNKQGYLELTKAELYNSLVTEANQVAAIAAAIAAGETLSESQQAYLAISSGVAAAKEEEINLTLQSAQASLTEAKARNVGNQAQLDQIAIWEKAINAKSKGIQIGLEQIDKLNLDNLDTFLTGSREKNNKKYYSDEFDRYWEIKKIIDEVTHAMEKFEEVQSHLFGQELVTNLKQVNELLTEQKENYEQLREFQLQEAEELRTALSANGAEFDEQGYLTNYADVTSAMFSAYAGDDESEVYTQFKKNIERYDSLFYSEMVETLDNIESTHRKILENNLKAWETEIEINLDLAEAKREWKEFFSSVSKDFKSIYTDFDKEILSAAESFRLYKDSNFAIDYQAVQSIKNEIDKIRSGEGSDIFLTESEAANNLVEYSNKLREDAQNLYEQWQNAWESYVSSVDQVVDKWSTLISKFDRINDSLSHQATMIELLYGDTEDATGFNAHLYEVQSNNTIAQMTALKEATSSLQKEYEELLEAGASETDKDVQTIKTAIEDNEKTMETTIENYLNTIQSQFKNSISIALSQLSKVMNGGISQDDFTTRWQDATKYSKEYYDNVERIYQVESLEQQWQKAINNTSTLKYQQRLKELMDAQVKTLEAKEKLNQKDIELAQQQLTIAQAQIALEEAQNNKSTMKLTRNEAGDWTYQYVADEDDIADKQQALMDATYNYYEKAKEYYQSTASDIVSLEQEYLSRIEELETKALTASVEEREKIKEEEARLYDLYYGENGYITLKQKDAAYSQQQLNSATILELQSLYEIDASNYESMTEKEKELVDSLRAESINSYQALLDAVAGGGGIYEQMRDKCLNVNQESLSSWYDLANNIVARWDGDGDSVKSAILDFYNNCLAYQQAYDTAVQAGCEASGINFMNLTNEIDATVVKTQEAIDKVVELKEETDGLSYARDQVEAMGTAWEEVNNQLLNAIANLENYTTSLTNKVVSAFEQVAQAAHMANEAIANSGVGSSNSSLSEAESDDDIDSNSTNSFKLDPIKSLYFVTKRKTGYEGNYSDFLEDLRNEERDGNLTTYGVAVATKDELSQYWGSNIRDMSDMELAELIKEKLEKRDKAGASSFDTGGYTGDWSDASGRLAILHSKELVLNKEDTENILDAVSAVRDIKDIGNSIISSIMQSIGNLFNSNFSINSVYPQTISNDTSSNNIFNINADFPNATNVDEIKEAILSLPTLASQFLSQNKK